MGYGNAWYDRGLGQLRRLARLSAGLGGAVLLICVGLTVVDVILRNFFADTIRGTIEMTQLCIMWAAFLCIPLGFANGNHIAVELMTSRISNRLRALLQGSFALIGALMLLAYLWWGGAQAIESFTTGELTSTIGLPVWLYWMPVMFGMGLSLICALFAAISLFAGSFTTGGESDA